mgnify:CR=1 FL=1
MTIKGPKATRRPDAIVYINGLPVVVMEFKSAIKEDTTIHDAYVQITTRYMRDIPELYNLRAPGITCLRALGTDGRTQKRDFIRNPINHSKGCGGVMRVAPVGLFYNLPNIERVNEIAADSEEYKMFRYFEQRLLEKEGLATELDAANAEKLEFFHNVATTDDRGNYDKDGDIGAKVLGDRNRWAVICMDGNDMGSQMTEKLKSLEGDGEKGVKMSRWVKAMSAAIDRCSTQAAKAGIKAVYDKWAPSDDQQNIEGEKKFVLPLRPLVVGGDDITILCHVNYAMDFVKAACETFEQVSREENDKAVNEIGESIWPATGGKISISAGILYCPVSLPLHSAIVYTEALLASAKTRGRAVKAASVAKGESAKCPTPASVDWEHITDSVIETPAIYRRRHLYFADPDIGKNVCLTMRPYTLQEFSGVESLVEKYRKKIPTSTRHKVTVALAKSQNDRMAFVASIAKNHKDLAEDLMEPGFEIFGVGKSKWVESLDHKEISTPVVDAMQLLEEEMRMKEGTNND